MITLALRPRGIGKSLLTNLFSLRTWAAGNKNKSLVYKSKIRVDRSYEHTPIVATHSIPAPDLCSFSPVPKGGAGKDLSLIKEKAEPGSNNVSAGARDVKVVKPKKKQLRMRNNLSVDKTDKDLQGKLEKVLQELNAWKDKFLKDRETPVKQNGSNFNGLYSPTNRLMSAPYQFNSMLSSSFYSNVSGNNRKTINHDTSVQTPGGNKQASKVEFVVMHV